MQIDLALIEIFSLVQKVGGQKFFGRCLVIDGAWLRSFPDQRCALKPHTIQSQKEEMEHFIVYRTSMISRIELLCIGSSFEG